MRAPLLRHSTPIVRGMDLYGLIGQSEAVGQSETNAQITLADADGSFRSWLTQGRAALSTAVAATPTLHFQYMQGFFRLSSCHLPRPTSGRLCLARGAGRGGGVYQWTEGHMGQQAEDRKRTAINGQQAVDSNHCGKR